MRLERRVGPVETYSEFIAGSLRRVTTKGGPARARELFDILKSGNGVSTSQPMPLAGTAAVPPRKQQPPKPRAPSLVLQGPPRWGKS